MRSDFAFAAWCCSSRGRARRARNFADLGLHHQLDVHRQLCRASPSTRPRKQPTSAMRSRIVCQAMSGCARLSSFINAACVSSRRRERRERAGRAGELADQHARRSSARRSRWRSMAASSPPSCSRRSPAPPAAGCCARPSACRDGGAPAPPARWTRRQDRASTIASAVADLQYGRRVGDILGRRAPVAIFARARRCSSARSARPPRAPANRYVRFARAACPCRSCRSSQLPAISAAASAGMMPRRPCTVASAASNLQIFSGAIFVGENARIDVAAEVIAEQGRIDRGGMHGLSVPACDLSAGRVENVLRLEHHRAIDHLTVDSASRPAPRARGEHALRPVDLLGTRRHCPVRAPRPASGGCIAWRRSRMPRAKARSASSFPSSSISVVTPQSAVRTRPRARRCDLAGRVDEPSLVAREIEIDGVVQRPKARRCTAGAPAIDHARESTARGFDQRHDYSRRSQRGAASIDLRPFRPWAA